MEDEVSNLPETYSVEMKTNRQNVNVNALDSNGITPLMLATSQQDLNVFKALLHSDKVSNASADVNVTDNTGRTVLHHAVDHSNFEAVRILLEMQTNGAPAVDVNVRDGDGRTALMLAASKGHGYVFRTLPHSVTVFSESADVNGLTHKSPASFNTTVDVNSPDHAKNTLLHYIVREGNVESARMLLALNSSGVSYVNVNARDREGRAPLLLAAHLQHWPVFHALINSDAILTSDVDFNSKDNSGNTLLHCSAKSYAIEETVRTMLALKKDGSPRDHVSLRDGEGRTALMLAACTGHWGVVQVIMDSEQMCSTCLDVNEVDKEGNTLLHYAAKSGNVWTVRSLLELKSNGIPMINVKVRDGNGRTAVELAAERKHLKVLEAFLDHIAILSEYETHNTPSFASFPSGRIENLAKCGILPNINFQDKNGETLVMKAAKEGKCK